MRDALKTKLLEEIAHYQPGTPVTPARDDAVKTAAAALEAAAGAPDLIAAPHLIDGVWVSMFDSRDLLHQANMKVMSVGALPEQFVPIRTTFQELRPAFNFYRNTMVMEAGPQRLAFNYISTARFEIKPDAPNVFQVFFTTTSFVPADARISADELRAALGMPAGMALDVTMAPRGPFPSIVTYADDELRINRGESYVAVLRRLR
jgi:pimeloyl-ACP methyl ester carboxylesterase